MTRTETVLHLVRLGLNGDAASVRRFARKMLKEPDLDQEVREGISKLLAAAPETAPVRWANAAAAPETEPGLLVTFDPTNAEEDPPILAKSVAGQVEQIVLEHTRHGELEAVGLVPTRTVLLTGPPGVGKTMTARHLANLLSLPLHRIDLSLLMSSYLGKTGQNLSGAILRARQEPCVLLVDEFDAVAKRRDDPTDVGELKRIVNVLLVELEEWPATGILIAATNHPELLDRAIWRRFERVVLLSLPEQEARRQLVERQLRRHGRAAATPTIDLVVAATEGSSASDVVTLVRASIRRSVLGAANNLDQLLIEGSLERLVSQAATDPAARALYCRVAHEVLGASQREIAERLNVSHVTVGRALRADVGVARPARIPRKETDA